MKSRRILAALLALLLVYTIAVTAVYSRRYTHEELMAMPAMELYDLFRSRGLIIPDGLGKFTDEELADTLKERFEYWLWGDVQASYAPWWELVDRVQNVYLKLVVEPFPDFRYPGPPKFLEDRQ